MTTKFFTVQTNGEAYLRNGLSGLTGLEVGCNPGIGRAVIRAINSKGNVTSGWIDAGLTDFIELCYQIVEWDKAGQNGFRS